MSIKALAIVLGAAFAFAGSASQAFAGKLVALSIGVSTYTQISSLPSTVNDAKAVGKLLAEFGYDVRLVRDPTSRVLRDAVDEFVQSARGADVAVLYFSGHGKQVNGETYMIPADGGSNTDGFADHLAVSAVVARLEAAGVKAKIVFVDACRNNPYVSRNGTLQGDATRNASAAERFILGPGVMMSFASAAGELSGDSNVAFSDYTQALITVLQREQRIELTELTRAARKLVVQRSAANVGNRQTPFEVSSIDDPVHFVRTGGGRVREMGRSQAERAPVSRTSGVITR
ncbi:MAG: caspase family protein [Hyphomonadaceae bacterium]|jgi:uncharacterized caspase-like protein|nr:caspase family protein [Hyphomonadaceae bacterium]